jgi:hypothetical protein
MVLDAKTPTERRLKEYLDANASDARGNKPPPSEALEFARRIAAALNVFRAETIGA